MRLRKSLQCLVKGSEALTRVGLEKTVYVSKKVSLTPTLKDKLQRFLLWDIPARRKRYTVSSEQPSKDTFFAD